MKLALSLISFFVIQNASAGAVQLFEEFYNYFSHLPGKKLQLNLGEEMLEPGKKLEAVYAANTTSALNQALEKRLPPLDSNPDLTSKRALIYWEKRVALRNSTVLKYQEATTGHFHREFKVDPTDISKHIPDRFISINFSRASSLSNNKTGFNVFYGISFPELNYNHFEEFIMWHYPTIDLDETWNLLWRSLKKELQGPIDCLAQEAHLPLESIQVVPLMTNLNSGGKLFAYKISVDTNLVTQAELKQFISRLDQIGR